MSDCWIIDSTCVATENFGDESIVIHFVSGKYFSFQGAASWIWEQLNTPLSVGDLDQILPEPARRDAASVLEKLREENLIIPAERPSASIALSAPAEWTAPHIEVFSDLAELIALDPVHDVNAMMGWPNRPSAVK